VKPGTIPEYIAFAPPQTRAKLRELRTLIAAGAPGATQGIKWRIAAFSYDRILVAFAGFERHVGFYPTPSALRAFAPDIARFKHAAGSVRFPLDAPLPKALIKRIVAFRVKELRDTDAKWRTPARTKRARKR
jgi:uncharacterized protein YdhG (YjbR/CyaY superfamily)